MDPQKRKVSVAWLSVISNTLLVLMKLVIGLLIGSVSVISEAIHSGVDLVAAGIALFAVKSAGKPADREHPYGHGKIENISGTIEALLIFLAAGWIILEAVEKLRHPQSIETIGWGVGVMSLSAIANYIVSHFLFKVGRETDSVALQADAWHLRTDVWTSLGVMIGLATIWIGSILSPEADLRWVDPLAAIVVAILIIKAAWELTLHAARDLLDTVLPAEEEEAIRSCAVERLPAIRGIHALRTRKSGSFRFVELHASVDGNMSVRAAHQVIAELEEAIKARYAGTTVTIHVDPCAQNCGKACISGCMLSEAQRAARGDRTPLPPAPSTPRLGTSRTVPPR